MYAVPATTGVTTPEELTEATDGLPLLHTPPVVVSLKVIVVPTATLSGPVIDPALGNGLIVAILVACDVPQVLLIV
jgi:hypothetical protein